MFYLWVTLDDLDLNLSSFPAKDECLAKLEEQLVLARQAERKIPRMRCLHNYINYSLARSPFRLPGSADMGTYIYIYIYTIYRERERDHRRVFNESSTIS